MSSLTLAQTKTAVGAGIISSFQGIGGTSPYTYSVRANGAGGTIDPSTGIYTAPSSVPFNPAMQFDTVQVRDSLSNIATAQIMVGTPLLLFCEIIQNQLQLPIGRVYLWDQKLFQPTDSGLYIVVSVMSCKPFGNTNQIDPTTGNSIQSVNMLATLQLDIISRDAEARDRKEEVVMALNSTYAEQQMEANSFLIGRLPAGGRFVNNSHVDGAAIPYRFTIDVNIQYFVTKNVPQDYFNNFPTPPFTVITDA